MKNLIAALALSTGLAALPALAEAAMTQSEMEILKDKVRADKKALVSANMELTDAEAKTFWPIYEEYQKQLGTLNERTDKLILSYADAYKKKTMNDAIAKKLLTEFVAIGESEAKLRKDFSGKLSKALNPMKAARYLQIENKIRAVINYELAGGIPLV